MLIVKLRDVLIAGVKSIIRMLRDVLISAVKIEDKNTDQCSIYKGMYKSEIQLI